MLYITALAFFVGHEIGHHLEGHDGYYTINAVAEEVQCGVSDGMERQALELQADRWGVQVSQVVATIYMLNVLDVGGLAGKPNREHQFNIALLLSIGVCLSLSVFNPVPADLDRTRKKTHPPGAFRGLWISSLIGTSIEKNFPDLLPKDRQRIRAIAMEWAAVASIKSGDPREAILDERKERSELIATRAVGIRRALFDPQTIPYLKELLEIGDNLRPRLRPRI